MIFVMAMYPTGVQMTVTLTVVDGWKLVAVWIRTCSVPTEFTTLS
jgi:hypothetical protein